MSKQTTKTDALAFTSGVLHELFIGRTDVTERDIYDILHEHSAYAELVGALEGVLHHNAATKPEYQLPKSLVAHVERALAKARG